MSSLALTEFALRMAGGLGVGLAFLGRGEVPTAFVRTAWLVILGLLALAMAASLGQSSRAHSLAIGSYLALAWLASICWGLGAARPGEAIGLLSLALAGALLASTPSGDVLGVDAAPAIATRYASAVLLGSVTLAMLLGHHYLTAPTMAIDPLARLVGLSGLALLVRAGLAGWGVFGSIAGPPDVGSEAPIHGIFLIMRWGVGLAVPAVGLVLAWRTLAIRSTQSATGILYVTVTLTIVGELTAMILSGRGGMPV